MTPSIHKNIKDIIRGLKCADDSLRSRIYETRGLPLMCLSWRATLKRILPIHRSRLEEYGAVAAQLYVARDRTTQRRRDLGYESDC